MKKKKLSKMIPLAISSVILLSIIGANAYYNQTLNAENPFSTATPQMEIIELFDGSDKWVPGEQKQKEVQIKNGGTVEMLMRLTVNQELYDKDGVKVTPIPSQDGESLFEIGWNETYFTEHFQEDPNTTGVYYYKKILGTEEATNKTNNIMNYVEFADWAGNEYQSHEAHVNIIVEMLQYEGINAEALGEAGWPTFSLNDATQTLTWSLND